MRAGIWCALGVALLLAPVAEAEVTGPPLEPAVPRVAELAPKPSRAPIRLGAGMRDWNGRLAHLAGTSHYDGGEWIYEDYPWSAYGAAPIGVAQAQQALAIVGDALPISRRLPGALTEVLTTSGAGPLVDEADLSELRLAVRGPDLHVIARTTTMREQARTALLLLFDTGRSSTPRHVPFGSGLRTSRADVAALVTASGTRIVDLVSGAATDAPAAADPRGFENTLATRLPLDRVTAGDEVRFVAATGLVGGDPHTLDPGGTAGPLAKVVPRPGSAVQPVHEREQALALAAHDIDRFVTPVSLARLRRGDRQRLAPGTGYSVRTMVTPAARSQAEGGTDGTLRDYGLYLPEGLVGGPAPATMLLRGSGMTAHSLPAITPGLVRQLDTIVVSPGGRSGFDLYNGSAYLDAEQALEDARSLVPIDRDRISVAGYSMGGFATYLFAATRPDRFAGAFVIEGPVGGIQPSAKTPIVNAMPDVVPELANLEHTPIAIYQGAIDANVPITNGLAAAQRLRALGQRYRLNVFPDEHFLPGVFDDWTSGAQYLKAARREPAPGRVRLRRNIAFERAVDTGAHSDAPLAGRSVGLRFDRAWFVRDLHPADPQAGTATIDVRTLARPEAARTPVHGVAPDLAGTPPSLREEQTWARTGTPPAPRNAFTAALSGADRVTLVLGEMDLTLARPLTGSVRTDTPVTVTLVLPSATCLAGEAGRTRTVERDLAPGEHALDLRRRTCARK